MSEANKTTLKQLLAECFLVIPDYQRDYAQGRDNPRDSNVLDMFIETISETLRKDDSSLSFDYVYGNIREENGVKIFYPVDGQQRLTTLFLFYVYCYQKDENKDFLSHFRYSVHPDTNSFIKLLIKNGAHEPELLNQNGSLKPESVEVWKEWLGIMSLLHTDPCVSALFNAYRKIELKLKGIKPESYINKLEAITFQFLDTKKNNLSDSVFWKMNARGRQLTESEVFKAGIIKNLDEPDKKENFAESFSLFYTKVFTDLDPCAKDNASEIDKVGIVSRVDRIIMRVIKSYCQWMTSENEFKLTEPVASERYWKKVFDKNDDILVAFPRFFQFYSNHNIGEFLPARACAGVKTYLLEELSVNVIPAMILFFRSMDPGTPDVEERFRYWIRVSLNLIDNSKSVSALRSVLNTLSNSEHIASIEKPSVFDDIKCGEKDVMLTEQLKEERLKAVLLLGDSGNKWREPIENAENKEFLSGKISILLTDGVNTTIDSFKSNLEYLEKLWHSQEDSYTLTRILLGYYGYDKPQVEIDMRCSDAKAAKNIIYNSLAGCFHKAVADGKKLNPAELDLKNKPYWIECLCKDGKLLINRVPRYGAVYSYYGNLVVLRNGKRIDTYGNIIFDKREKLLADLIKQGAAKCLYDKQQITDDGKPTNYFTDLSVRYKYKGHFFELYYYPFDGANDVYLLKDSLEDNIYDPNPYCNRAVEQKEVKGDAKNYYCFNINLSSEKALEDLVKKMNSLIEEGMTDHVISEL